MVKQQLLRAECYENFLYLNPYKLSIVQSVEKWIETA
jgi:hypothetical protein